MNPAVLQCGPALDTLGREHVESAPLWPCSHAAPMLLPCCPLAAPLPWLWPAGPGKALSGLGCHLGCHMPAQALTRSRASLTSVRWGTRSRSRRADLIPRHSPYPIPAPTLNRTLTLALALTLALTLTLTPTLTLMLTLTLTLTLSLTLTLTRRAGPVCLALAPLPACGPSPSPV